MNVHLRGEHTENFPKMPKWTRMYAQLDERAIFENTGSIWMGKQTLNLSVYMATKALRLSVHMDVCNDLLCINF